MWNEVQKVYSSLVWRNSPHLPFTEDMFQGEDQWCHVVFAENSSCHCICTIFPFPKGLSSLFHITNFVLSGDTIKRKRICPCQTRIKKIFKWIKRFCSLIFRPFLNHNISWEPNIRTISPNVEVQNALSKIPSFRRDFNPLLF